MTNNNKKQYGIYSVEEEYNDKGEFKGYRCSVSETTKKQGKLFVLTHGREYYKEKPESEDLEI